MGSAQRRATQQLQPRGPDRKTWNDRIGSKADQLLRKTTARAARRQQRKGRRQGPEDYGLGRVNACRVAWTMAGPEGQPNFGSLFRHRPGNNKI
jgi:hypothetical protein